MNNIPNMDLVMLKVIELVVRRLWSARVSMVVTGVIAVVIVVTRQRNVSMRQRIRPVIGVFDLSHDHGMRCS